MAYCSWIRATVPEETRPGLADGWKSLELIPRALACTVRNVNRDPANEASELLTLGDAKKRQQC